MNERRVSFIAREGKETPPGYFPSVQTKAIDEIQPMRAQSFRFE
jgi:hypothetical protein